MRRGLIVTLAVAALLGVLAFASPYLVPTRFAVDGLTAALKQATGRTLTVNGWVTASLWSEPGIALHDVVISNPPGGDPGQVATIETLKLSIDTADLLARRLTVKSLDVVRPSVSLVTNGAGKANWLPPEDEAAVALAFPVRITEGDIRYLDERSAATFHATEANLRITPPAADQPMEAEGHLTWNGQRVAVSVDVKSPQRLTGEGSPVDIAIDAPPLKATFSGRARLTDGVSLAGTGEVDMPSLREVLHWSGFTVAKGGGLGALKASAAIDSKGGTVTLSNLEATLDGMQAKGRATVDLSGARPRVDAALGVDRIDADPFFPRGPVTDDWSDARLSFAGLKDLDFNLDLIANGLVFRDLSVGKVNIKAKADAGKLNADFTEAELWGGTAKGTLTLDGSGEKPSLALTLEAPGVDAAQVFAALTGTGHLQGRGEVRASISANGASQRELVSTLAGVASVALSDGAVTGIDLKAMAAQAKTAIVTGWLRQPQARMPFGTLTVAFALVDGLAGTKDLRLEGPEMTVTGEGIVDLLRRSLDFKTGVTFPAAPDAPTTIVPPTPLLVKGAWSDPRTFLDVSPTATAAPPAGTQSQTPPAATP